MSKKKAGPLSQAGLLAKEGINPFNKGINPVAYYSPDKSKYILLWTQYDFEQFCSQLVWKNLPNGITSWNLNRMLYYRGSLVGFKFNDQIYILPYVIQGGLNIYGMATSVKPIAFNGRDMRADDAPDYPFNEEYKLDVDVNGDERDDFNAVLLFDAVPFNSNGHPISRFALNQTVIKEIADALARVNINMVVSNKKIVIQCKDPNQADVLKEELALGFGTESPFIVVHSPLEASTIQSTSDFNCDDIFNTVKNWDAIRCFMSGIRAGHFGIDKKERVATGELVGNEEQIDLISEMRLELAKQFAEKMNSQFGLDIQVELRAKEFGDDVNGNNQTKIQEEEAI